MREAVVVAAATKGQISRFLYAAFVLSHLGCAARGQTSLQPSFNIKQGYFSDNRSISHPESAGVTVQQTLISTSVTPLQQVSLDAYYGIDVVSAASWRVDGVSGASQLIKKERRHDGGVGIVFHDGTNGVGLSGGVSRETNYSSDFVNLSLEREFFDRNTTIGISSAMNRDEIRSLKLADTRPFPRRVWYSRSTLSVAQVLSPKLVFQMNFFYGRQTGYLAHPEHIVSFSDGTFGEEVHPESRNRFAVVGRFMRYFDTRSALHADYRFYGDDWGVLSHTIGSQWYQYLGRKLIGRVGYRFYSQTAADFYKGFSPERSDSGFQTVDGKLRTMTSHLYSLKLSTAAVQFPSSALEELEFNVNYDGYHQEGQYRASMITGGAAARF